MITLRNLATSLLVAAAVPAQALPAPDTLSRPAIVPVHTSDIGGRAEIWAAGTSWKASFHDGLVFYPFVGGDLPHHPFAWRTMSVEVGGTILSLPAAERPDHGAERVVYDLGLVLECYDVRAQGLEQSFVLPRPLGSGDLTIRGSVVSPLAAATVPARHGALAFVGSGGKVQVDYGAATAIDANGSRLPLATSCEGDQVCLHVPGAWLSTARFPVVVDPLISVGSIHTTAGSVVSSDVLHETISPGGGNGRIWVTYAFEVAAGDLDLLVTRNGTAFGAVPSTVFSRLSAVLSTDNGSLALSEGSDRVVLFFDEQDGAGIRYLGWHVHDAFDMTLDAFARLHLPPADSHYWRPDVGGRIDVTGTEIVIVFQVEAGTATFANVPTSRVDAMTMNPALFPGGGPGAIWTVRNQPSRDQERPAINQAATEDSWVVAMTENDNTPGDDWDVGVSTVDGNGMTGSSTVSTEEASTNTVHQQAPKIAGAAGRYLLSYSTAPISGGSPNASAAGDTMRSQRIDFVASGGGLGTGSRPHPSVTLHTEPTTALIPGGIAFDHVSASHWCTTARNTSDETYRFAKLGYRGEVTETAFVHTAPINDVLSVGGTTFRADSREFVLTYGENGPGADHLRAARVRYDLVAAPSLFGAPCGPGVYTGLAELEAKQQVGAQGVTIGLGGTAPDTGLAVLMVSLGTATVPLGLLGLGSCDLLVDPLAPNHITMLLGLVSSSGEASIAFDLPEDLPPTTYYFQWLYVDSANPLTLTFLTTAGLQVPTGR